MAMTYFDCCEPFPKLTIADVDRVYRFAWDEFSDREWKALDVVYRSLPGWSGYAKVKQSGWRGWLGRMQDGPPFWFGDQMNVMPWLTISVEPPGLQVIGRLAAADFRRWHEAFLAAVIDFPSRDAE